MHIAQIEIDNFKSFAEKTVIPFQPGFTTVSGPNGSGKSNIIDSVLFCLGLSSSRTMRAEKLTDLINHLSKRREASVKITFQTDQTFSNKNKSEKTVQDAILSATDTNESNEKALSEDGTITISRRIKDGPSGYTSTYYLNGRVATLTEIHEHLSRYNISPGCYNVMMQGDVAGIVNMSPMERRKIIDEIAGVAEFDRKIEQAQKELEATATNIERNAILLSEIEARLAQLATEREHALKYQALKDEKQACESQLLAAHYIQLKNALASTQSNIIAAKKQKTEAQQALNLLIASVESTRTHLLTLSEEVKRKGEDQQIAIKKQIEGLKGHIARKEDSIRFIHQQREEGDKGIERMQGEIARQKENIEVIHGDIQGLEQQLKELTGLFQTESKAYEKLNQRFDRLTESTGELSIQRAAVRERLTQAEDELAQANRDKMDTEAEQSRLQYEKELHEKQWSGSSEKRQSLSTREETLTQSLTACLEEKQVLEKQLKDTQLDYSQTRVAIQQKHGEFQQLQRNFLQLEAQKRAYDEVHFGRAVDTILNSDLDGIHGTLSQLLSIEEDYATALEIALGGRIQNIVVEDDRVAKQAIDLLQRNKAGRATLLPLNKIQRARSLPALPRSGGVIDFAINLIHFDPLYQDIFHYALGETLIVEDIEASRKLLNQYRMVTLDGSLMERSGAMTGGSFASNRSGNKLGNTKKIDLELAQQQARLSELEKQKNTLEKQLTKDELRLEALKGQYGELLQQEATLQTERQSVQNQLVELGEIAAPDSNWQADWEQKNKTLAQTQADLEKRIQEKSKQVEAIRLELTQIDNQLPADQVDAIRKEMSEVKFQMDYYDSQLRNVQAEIKGKQLEQSHQEQGIQHYLDRIEETKSSYATHEKDVQAAQEEIRLTQVQIQDLEAQTQVLDEELQILQRERDQVQQQLIEHEKSKHLKEREANQLDEQILAFKTRERELEPQIKTAEAELTESGIDPSSLDPSQFQPEEELQKKIQQLTRKMEGMEPVNMLAIKEFDEVQERQSDLSEKIETLSRESEGLSIKITGYHELKRAAFMKGFEAVDSQFKTIFAELSDGIGQLILTNPEDPFAGGLSIQAQPRGKKMQRMEAMSGGEKSLTSLAFVFSLQRYQPAPFYAMDEVDMNLDGINAEKLAHMVKRESESAQFIVVSLRKPMLECSDRTVGVTQKRDGITKVSGVKMRGQQDEPAASATEPAA